MVFGGPAFFNKYAHTLESNPLLPVIEIGLLLVFASTSTRRSRCSWATSRRARSRYVQKKYAGPPSRKTLASSTMIVSGLWLLVFLVVHVQAFSFGTSTRWPAGGRDLYRLEMENFEQPADRRLLRAQHGGRRLAPVARRVERAPVARRRPPALDAAHPAPPARSSRSSIAGGFIVIALWALLRRSQAGCSYDARRKDPVRRRSPKSGTGTSSR